MTQSLLVQITSPGAAAADRGLLLLPLLAGPSSIATVLGVSQSVSQSAAAACLFFAPRFSSWRMTRMCVCCDSTGD